MDQVVQPSGVDREFALEATKIRTEVRRIRSQVAAELEFESSNHAADPSQTISFNSGKSRWSFTKKLEEYNAKAIGTSNSSPGSVVSVID